MSKYIDVDKIKWREEYQECRCHNDRWEEKVTRVYKRDIDAMTPADVAPVVHGHWIIHYGGSVEFRECSICHKSIRNSIFSYCPFCGAKMDKKGDSDND